MVELISEPNLKLLQLMQITINTNLLENEIQYMDRHITYQVDKSMSGILLNRLVRSSVLTTRVGQIS